MPPCERVLTIAPTAAQVATHEPHKHTREPGIRGFALDRLVDFDNLHGIKPAQPSALIRPAKAIPNILR